MEYSIDKQDQFICFYYRVGDSTCEFHFGSYLSPSTLQLLKFSFFPEAKTTILVSYTFYIHYLMNALSLVYTKFYSLFLASCPWNFSVLSFSEETTVAILFGLAILGAFWTRSHCVLFVGYSLFLFIRLGRITHSQ